jgi:pyridoxamine 5'-phosphate oxidase
MMNFMSRNSQIPPSPDDRDFQADAAEPPLADDAEPLALFAAWFAEARQSEPNDPNGMALATTDADGLPDARMVLLKDFDARGFTFFTNLESAKARELAANPKAALLFHWKSLRRQVRIRGPVEQVSDAEADDYFATRALGSKIGAWASDQSRPMPDNLALERKVAEYTMKFALKQPPRPPHWSGFRLRPEQIEFWRDRPFRLHERLLFVRQGDSWTTSRLFP